MGFDYDAICQHDLIFDEGYHYFHLDQHGITDQVPWVKWFLSRKSVMILDGHANP